MPFLRLGVLQQLFAIEPSIQDRASTRSKTETSRVHYALQAKTQNSTVGTYVQTQKHPWPHCILRPENDHLGHRQSGITGKGCMYCWMTRILSGTHMVEGEKWLPKTVLWLSHVPCSMWMHMCLYICVPTRFIYVAPFIPEELECWTEDDESQVDEHLDIWAGSSIKHRVPFPWVTKF